MARPRGRRAHRQHQRRMPRGRRRRHGADRHGGRARAPRGVGSHGGRRRGVGPRTGMQRRDRGLHRARRPRGGGRTCPAIRSGRGTPDLPRDGARVRHPRTGPGRRAPGGAARRRRGRFGRRHRGDACGAGAPGRRTLRDPNLPSRRAQLRRGARTASASGDLRRRARRDPHGSRGLGRRVECDRRGRPAGVPEPRPLPGGPCLRPRRGSFRRREGCDDRRAELRRARPGRPRPPTSRCSDLPRARNGS